MLSWVLSMTYLWLKAGHITFMVFWMAGLFMLPRFFVYHQEELERDSASGPQHALWIERAQRLRDKPPGPGWDGVYTFETK